LHLDQRRRQYIISAYSARFPLIEYHGFMDGQSRFTAAQERTKALRDSCHTCVRIVAGYIQFEFRAGISLFQLSTKQRFGPCSLSMQVIWSV
jgi:hypothetical protein